MNPALETLILALSAGGGPVMRSPTLFIGAEARIFRLAGPVLGVDAPALDVLLCLDSVVLLGFDAILFEVHQFLEGKHHRAFFFVGHRRESSCINPPRERVLSGQAV